jgi:hypothetical protein
MIMPAQTVAIEEEPLDSNTQIPHELYKDNQGIMFFQSSDCFRDLLQVPLKGRASPVEKGGKL